MRFVRGKRDAFGVVLWPIEDESCEDARSLVASGQVKDNKRRRRTVRFALGIAGIDDQSMSPIPADDHVVRVETNAELGPDGPSLEIEALPETLLQVSRVAVGALQHV